VSARSVWRGAELVDTVILEESKDRAHAPPRAVTRLLDAIDWLIFRSEIHISEVACALGAVVWAVTIAAKPNLFETNPNYAQIATRAHELQVMVLALSILALSVAALGGYSVEMREATIYRLRRAAMLGYSFFYSSGVASFVMATGVGVTAGLHLVFAIMAAWGFWRLGRSARDLARTGKG
jgi:hypothetical protein